MIQIGAMAPDFSLLDQEGRTHTLSQYRGKWVLVYFYPKDNTPGCTVEAEEVRDRVSDFEKENAVVFGISVDSVQSHQKFANKLNLSFPLLADVEKEVVRAYGVWGEKKFLGKTYDGISRTSFLINPEGTVEKVYAQVKPAGHADAVLEDIRSYAEKRGG